jgi:hypothetical protein
MTAQGVKGGAFPELTHDLQNSIAATNVFKVKTSGN